MFRLLQSSSKLGAEVDAKNGGLEFEFNEMCSKEMTRGLGAREKSGTF